MTVSPTSWISNSLQAVEDLLANCAAFRTLMGAADVAAARAKCLWHDQRGGPAAPFAIIQLGACQEGKVEALSVVRHTDGVYVYLCWAPQAVNGDSERDKIMRELNSFGALLDQLEQLIGTGAYLERARLEWEPPTRTDDKGSHPGSIDATITFRWEI